MSKSLILKVTNMRCLKCHKMFKQKAITQVYCSLECNKLSNTRSEAIRLLKDNSLSFRDIAKILGVSHVRISNINNKKGRNSNINKKKNRSQNGKKYKCKYCNKEFLANEYRKYCSYECAGKGRWKIDWPEDIITVIRESSSYRSAAKKLGVSVVTLLRKLREYYGWTEDMIKEYDGRRRRLL